MYEFTFDVHTELYLLRTLLIKEQGFYGRNNIKMCRRYNNYVYLRANPSFPAGKHEFLVYRLFKLANGSIDLN